MSEQTFKVGVQVKDGATVVSLVVQWNNRIITVDLPEHSWTMLFKAHQEALKVIQDRDGTSITAH